MERCRKTLFVKCVIDNVWYRCHRQSCSWYDTNRKYWRIVRGLSVLTSYGLCGRTGMTEIANYGGKLLILWDKIVHDSRQYKHIWCAVIAHERRDRTGDAVWGSIEWATIVHTVPRSYSFLRSVLNVV